MQLCIMIIGDSNNCKIATITVYKSFQLFKSFKRYNDILELQSV